MTGAQAVPELRRRVDRTLDYLDELQRHADLNPDAALIVGAVYRSLTTPLADGGQADG